MPLVKTIDILNHAAKYHYGIPSFSVISYETIKCVIQAAENEKVPIVLQYYPGYDSIIPPASIMLIVKHLAESASVPVSVHLDQAATFSIAMDGVREGFSSVMINGSRYHNTKNVTVTRKVVRFASVFGVAVEGSVGEVGVGKNIDGFKCEGRLTEAAEAAAFVGATKCDALSISVGNMHGEYISQPNLDFQRIRAIKEAVDVPLVLHGCSGIPDEQMREAVRQGITKFNIATDLYSVIMESLKKTIVKDGNLMRYLFTSQQDMLSFITQKINLLNPKRISF